MQMEFNHLMALSLHNHACFIGIKLYEIFFRYKKNVQFFKLSIMIEKIEGDNLFINKRLHKFFSH